jgi:SAM-dependent methyltransferase
MSGYTTTWLGLREPADAEARAVGLVGLIPAKKHMVISDLGCGSGSMARWLGARLDAGQRWILYDHDPVLLEYAAAHVPRSEGVEVRRRDITRLTGRDLAGSDLVTASALLDILTAEGIAALAAACAGIPALLTLSVIGEVRLDPVDPLDEALGAAFDAHQRRDGKLGPDAFDAAVAAFEKSHTVTVRDSPWHLAAHPQLTAEWLRGWVGAAAEERPDLDTAGYLARRLADLPVVRVGHKDLLAV